MDMMQERAAMKKGRRGFSFDDFLEEEGLRAETEAAAIKRVIAYQIVQPAAGWQQSKDLPGAAGTDDPPEVQAERRYTGVGARQHQGGCSALDRYGAGGRQAYSGAEGAALEVCVKVWRIHEDAP